MTIQSLGKIAPATAGTPQQCTSDTTLKVRQIIVSQIPGMTGKVVFGTSGVNRTTLAGVIKQFNTPDATGEVDTLIIESPGNTIQLSKFYVDAANNGEGVIVSYAIG